MIDPIANARTVIKDRFRRHPDSPFYAYAAKEMARIDDVLGSPANVDQSFYDSLIRGLGLMCTRELDAVDPPFCDAIDGMLEEIRLRVT